MQKNLDIDRDISKITKHKESATTLKRKIPKEFEDTNDNSNNFLKKNVNNSRHNLSSNNNSSFLNTEVDCVETERVYKRSKKMKFFSNPNDNEKNEKSKKQIVIQQSVQEQSSQSKAKLLTFQSTIDTSIKKVDGPSSNDLEPMNMQTDNAQETQVDIISKDELTFYENPEEDYYHLLCSNTNIDFQKNGRPPCPRYLPECYLSILWQLISENYAYRGNQACICLDYLHHDLKLQFLADIQRICMSQNTFLNLNTENKDEHANSSSHAVFKDKEVTDFFTKHWNSYNSRGDISLLKKNMVWDAQIHVHDLKELNENTNFNKKTCSIGQTSVVQNDIVQRKSELLIFSYMSNMNKNALHIDDMSKCLAFDKIALIESIVEHMRLKSINLAGITKEEYVYTLKVFTDYSKIVKNSFFFDTEIAKISKNKLLIKDLKSGLEFERYYKTISQLQVPVSPEQRFAIIKIIEQCKNTFITGGAGVGKSHLLRILREKYKYTNKVVYFTASTGKASMQINGKTLHSWSGLGLGNKSLKQSISDIYAKGGANMQNNRVLERYRRTDVLIVDEVSMTDKGFLELFNEVCNQINNKKHMQNSVETYDEKDEKKSMYFGNIQIVMCGDFFQLPPVEKGASNKTSSRYCFLSPIWEEAIECFMELRKVYRQNDKKFINVLNQMRYGELTKDSISLLKTRIAKDHTATSGSLAVQKKNANEKRKVLSVPEKAVRLYSKNSAVDNLNLRVLREKFNTPYITFRWQLKFNPQRHVSPAERKFIENFFKKSLTVDEIQKYKVGCRVMLLTNVDQDLQLVNGCTGNILEMIKTSDAYARNNIIITEHTDPRDETAYPLVQFDHIENPVFISPFPFIFNNNDKEDDKNSLLKKQSANRDMVVESDKGWTAMVLQVPLAVAHAFSIHKSQGMTIEHVSVSMKNCFANGQAYVACSRASSLEGLYLDSFQESCVKTDPVVKQYYENMNKKNAQQLYQHQKEEYEERRRQRDKYYMGSKMIRDIREGEDGDFIEDLRRSSFNPEKYYFNRLKSSKNSENFDSQIEQ